MDNDNKNGEPILRLDNVFKRFGGLTAVNDVSVDIHAGEVIGLVGDNGAGKSTLIKMISGVYRPDGGSIYLGDQEITLPRPWKRAIWASRPSIRTWLCARTWMPPSTSSWAASP